MRAKEPDISTVIDRDGVKIGYEVFNGPAGTAEPATVVLLPAWLIGYSRVWKLQVPYLSRYFRVITLDPRGNGRSGRPRESAQYTDGVHAADAIAVMDALGIDQAVFAGLSRGAWRAILGAIEFPDRVAGVISMAPTIPHLTAPAPGRTPAPGEDDPFRAVRTEYHGWQKFNAHYWRAAWPEFLRFFIGQAAAESHSSKVIEDAIGWGLETDPDVAVIAEEAPPDGADRAEVEALISRVRCPMLVIHGDRDNVIPVQRGRRLAELTGARYIEVAGGGHLLPGRHPVAINRWCREFVESVTGFRPTRATPEERPAAGATPARVWTRALDRPKRVLYISSPIGLGHARRDLAIVEELRTRQPGVQVEWLAQHPVTAMLAARGESVHPASAWLSSESGHWESESEDHDLHAFQAVRRMDEVLVNNFMVFNDLVDGEEYDLWVADEGWDIDHFLHQNPELKCSAYAWLTDFVGWVPMPDGGPPEAALTADYNGEMVEHIDRFPRLRDRALFVGDPADLIDAPLGPGLPTIADWTRSHFDFTGYITGFDPAEVADREALRKEFGWAPDERICLVSAGGTRVGEPFIRRVIAALPAIRRRVDGMRMVVVAGPRIDAADLVGTGRDSGAVEVHAYVPDLHRRLAACDVAVVQGGLTTTMELVAAGRPFIYVPIRHHFEQSFHVAHRLDRYQAGLRMDYGDLEPDRLADAVVAELGRTPSYLPVTTDGAARAADRLAELL